MTTTSVELAERFGTPLYLYRADHLHQAVDELRAALPQPHQLYYSVKANPNVGVMRQLTGRGVGAEVSSAGELAVAQATGQGADTLLYTGPGKTPAEVVHAIGKGVRRFSVESVEDHRRLCAAAAECGTDVEYLIRVNGPRPAAGSGLRMTGRPSQFGIDVEAIWSAPQLFAGTTFARPAGLHFFPVTNMADEDALLREFTESIRAARDILDRAGIAATVVDLGGGFAAPFAQPGERPRYRLLRAGLERALDVLLPGWRAGRPAIAFESGRYLVGSAGTLLSSVIDVKYSGGRTFVVLDAGINVLGGISGTGRLLPFAAQPAGATTRADVTLVGPLCTPLDVLSRKAHMADARVADLVAIPNVGAYGLTASVLAFLSRTPPREVVLDDGDEILGVTTLRLQAVETVPEICSTDHAR